MALPLRKPLSPAKPSKSFSIKSGPVSNTSPDNQQLTLVSSSDLTTTINPFDSSLGVLDSFAITWDITHSLTGTVGAVVSSFGFGGGGSFTLNGPAYFGVGNQASASGSLGETINASYNILSSKAFAAADAGVTYNPDYLSAVTGVQPYTVAFKETVTANFSQLTDLTGLAAGTVTVDYIYTPSAVPEPGTWMMISAGLMGLGAVSRRQRRRIANPVWTGRARSRRSVRRSPSPATRRPPAAAPTASGRKPCVARQALKDAQQ